MPVQKTIVKRTTRSQTKQTQQETLPEPLVEIPDAPLMPILPHRQPAGTASCISGDNYSSWSVTMYQRWQDPVG
tara:strand:- start:681 stop:902 length:222 start_codon:yes stop_codon:yes gene_type:complete